MLGEHKLGHANHVVSVRLHLDGKQRRRALVTIMFMPARLRQRRVTSVRFRVIASGKGGGCDRGVKETASPTSALAGTMTRDDEGER
jgi:hypothetical protein